MKEQNVHNHRRFIVLWHIVGSLGLLVALVGSIMNLVHVGERDHISAIVLVIICLLLFLIAWYCRVFALKAQDRAIRAEENFRHFVLTGKPFDKGLRLGQIIALRFASDEELPVLAKRALGENLNSQQIKLAIKNWRADHHRV